MFCLVQEHQYTTTLSELSQWMVSNSLRSSEDEHTPTPTNPPLTQGTLDFTSNAPPSTSYTPESSHLAAPPPNGVELVNRSPMPANTCLALSNLTNDFQTISHGKGKLGAKTGFCPDSDCDRWRHPVSGIAPRRSQRLKSRGPYFVVDRTSCAASHFYFRLTNPSSAHFGFGRSRTPHAARPPSLFSYLRHTAAGANTGPYAAPTHLQPPYPFASPVSCGLMQKRRVGGSATILPPSTALLSGGTSRAGSSQSHGQSFTYDDEEPQNQGQGANTSRGGNYGPGRAGNAGTDAPSYSYSSNPFAWNAPPPRGVGSPYDGRDGPSDVPYAGRPYPISRRHRSSEDNSEEDEPSDESEDKEESEEGEPRIQSPVPGREVRDGGRSSNTAVAPHQQSTFSRVGAPHSGTSSSRAACGESPSSAVSPQHVAPPGPHTARPGTKKRGNLPRATTDLLKAWIRDHTQHPYPTEDEKRQLCLQTGMNSVQMSNWMINVS